MSGAFCVVLPRFWEVIHHDGVGGAAWTEPSAVQLSVQKDTEGGGGGGGLHRGGVLHGDLQREGPRPPRSQRVSDSGIPSFSRFSLFITGPHHSEDYS